MSRDLRLLPERLPRASGYHPDWVLAGAGGGANPLWLAEWLADPRNVMTTPGEITRANALRGPSDHLTSPKPTVPPRTFRGGNGP